MIGNRQIHSAIRLGLEETLRWRQNQEENFERKERELDREERDLQEERKDLNEKIAAVQKHQEKAKHERGLLSDLEINRKRQIIFSGLQSENELLQERSIEYKKIEETQKNNLQNMLTIPEIAKKVEEYEDFLENEETLSQLPDSYRKAILSHHDHVRKDLEPVFSAMNTALPRSDLDLTAITLQIFTEPLPDEDISELVVILPVRFDRCLHWHDGDISLEDMLLFRINGALSGVLKKVGMPKSVIREEDFDGFVLLHLSIVSELNGDIKVALQSEIARINRHATEFQVAQISLDPVFLSSELIEFDDEETV
jgi:hypothetical protein